MKTLLRVIVLSSILTASLNAALVIFEGFDDVSDWTDSENILTTAVDPIDGGTNSVGVLAGDAAGEFATKALSSAISASSNDLVTVFYRVAANDTNLTSNTFASTLLLSSDSGDGFAEAGPLATIKDGVDFTTRGSGSEATVLTGQSNLTWYNVWLVFDMDTWSTSSQDSGDVDVYISTGAAPGSPTFDSAVFRQDQANQTIDSLELVRGGRFGDVVYYDDIYIDTTGANLAYPVPEPTTTAFVLGFLALGAVWYRRRRA